MFLSLICNVCLKNRLRFMGPLTLQWPDIGISMHLFSTAATDDFSSKNAYFDEREEVLDFAEYFSSTTLNHQLERRKQTYIHFC